jgi:hypothetical protein
LTPDTGAPRKIRNESKEFPVFDRVRYGYYLRPSPEMCAAPVRIHHLFERQYGLQVAGKFMPHCTVKGFFKSSSPVEQICSVAASIADGMPSFPV